MLNYSKLFPFYDSLGSESKRLIENNIIQRDYKERVNINTDLADSCLGIMYILGGEVRVYINTEDNKEITLFRLFEDEFCLFSASCMFHDLDYEIFIDIMKDTKALIIPPNVINKLNDTELGFIKHINALMSKRLSDAMWVIDQILSKRLDERIIDLLLNEYSIQNTKELTITHDEIANHLGSSREVITRMLKHMAMDNLVTLKRGKIILNDVKALLNK